MQDHIDDIARDLRARYYDRKGREMTTLYADLPCGRKTNWQSIARDAVELVAKYPPLVSEDPQLELPFPD